MKSQPRIQHPHQVMLAASSLEREWKGVGLNRRQAVGEKRARGLGEGEHATPAVRPLPCNLLAKPACMRHANSQLFFLGHGLLVPSCQRWYKGTVWGLLCE